MYDMVDEEGRHVYPKTNKQNLILKRDFNLPVKITLWNVQVNMSLVSLGIGTKLHLPHLYLVETVPSFPRDQTSSSVKDSPILVTSF